MKARQTSGGLAHLARTYRRGLATGFQIGFRNLEPISAAVCGVFRKDGNSLSPTGFSSLTRGDSAKASALRRFLFKRLTSNAACQPMLVKVCASL